MSINPETPETTEEGLRIFDAASDERMEWCIHCNAEWYSLHYIDGVCNSCQKKRLLGRAELARRSDFRRKAVILLLGLAIVAVILILVS